MGKYIPSLRWVFGIVFLFTGFGAFKDSFISALAYLGVGSLLIPPLSESIYNKLNLQMPAIAKATVIVCLLIMAGQFSTKSETLGITAEKKPPVSITPTSTTEPTKSAVIAPLDEKKLYKVEYVEDTTYIQVLHSGQKVKIHPIGLVYPEQSASIHPLYCIKKIIYDKENGLLEGKNIKLISDKKINPVIDFWNYRYYIILEDGTDIIEQMIREGYGKTNENETYASKNKYLKAEKLAIQEKKGFWGNTVCQPEPTKYIPPPTNTPYIPPPTKTPVPQVQQQNIYQAPPQQQPVQQTEPANTGGEFSCNCGKVCGAMSSCAEAQYQLNVCGCQQRDADNDGIACDTMCQ